MKIKIEKITPARAEELLKLNTGNRKINNLRVSGYADQMRRGQWKLTHQGISISPKKLGDGQHRLKAVIASGCTVEMVVAYEDNDENFHRIDTGKRRSPGDVFQIEGVKNATAAASGVAKYLKYVKNVNGLSDSNHRVKITNQDILEIYRQNDEYFQELFRHAKNCYTKLRLYPMADIMGITAFLNLNKEYDLQEIKKFFSMLHTNIASDDININLLRETIVRNALESKKMTHIFKINLLKKTWNNYTKGLNNTRTVLTVARGEKVLFD